MLHVLDCLKKCIVWGMCQTFYCLVLNLCSKN
uniref:Uncharacterized protein n=1 Tax=Arundo donax TaxID=35708 RepID=A0A0A9DZW2_ARUDO